jgi:transcriptional regulator with XRE-family HTH domain
MSIQPLHSRVPEFQLKDRLRLARELKNFEQVDIAAELGISRATVSNYERGVTMPGKLVINAWAVVCDVDVEWLKTGRADAAVFPSDPGGGESHPKPKAVSNPMPLDYKVAGSGIESNVTHLPFRRLVEDDLPLEIAA